MEWSLTALAGSLCGEVVPLLVAAVAVRLMCLAQEKGTQAVTQDESGRELDIIEVEVDMDMALEYEEAMKPAPTENDIISLQSIRNAQIEVDQMCGAINLVASSTQHDNNKAHK